MVKKGCTSFGQMYVRGSRGVAGPIYYIYSSIGTLGESIVHIRSSVSRFNFKISVIISSKHIKFGMGVLVDHT